MQTIGYAAKQAKAPLEPFTFERRDPGAHDVVIEILYSGVCHSDLHQVLDEWGGAVYPIVPGHEIVGRVTAVGSAVTKFAVGDLAGVGCMVDSCRACAACRDDEEQFCEKQTIFTYGTIQPDGTPTYGGYANNIVVEEAFTLKIPPNLDLAGTAPLLCAGITTYSPLRRWNVKPGMKVGVVGLGGLGHMALKFAHSFGAHVVQFTTSLRKKDDALRLGADEVVLSSDADGMGAHAASFDFILDTVSAPHDLDRFLALLKRGGTMTLVGVPESPTPLAAPSLIFSRASLAGSLIGGIAETQEMLDYCGEHGITSDIEVIPMAAINDAYERMLKSDVKYRFVIDIATVPKAA